MKKILFAAVLGIFALSASAQDKLSGIWKTDEDNTLVKIEKQNDVFVGKVISSDDKDTKPGMIIIKDLKPKKEKFTGQIYVVERDRWFDGTFQPSDDKLKISVTWTFISKTVVWTKSKQ